MAATPRPGDHDALLANVGWLRSLARSLVADSHLAEDAVQETCLAALESSPRTDRPVRGWLATVLRNFVRQSRREERRRENREARAAREEALSSTAELVERVSEQREVIEAVLRLEEPYRATVLLRFFEGLPPRKIAEKTGVPVPTVKTRLARGLERLRIALDRAHGGNRRAWLAALLPLAKPSAIPSSILGGLLVDTKLKVAIGALSLIGVSTALLTVNRSPEGAPAAQVAAAPEPDARETPEPSAVFVPDPAPARREIPVPVSPKKTAAASAPSPATATDALLHGRVFDPEAFPLAGVEVRLKAWDGSDANPPSAVSGPGGIFEMEAPRLGGRLVCAEPNTSTVLAGLFRPGDSRIEPVVVVAPALALGGRVLDEEGRALEGSRVEVQLPAGFRARFPVVLDASADGEWAAYSDAEGRFEIEEAPLLRGALLRASLPGFETSYLPAPDSSNLALEIVLRRSRLAREALRGEVLDPGGAPLPGARVSAGGEATVTDLAGQFALDLGKDVFSPTLIAAKEGFLAASYRPPLSPETGSPVWPEFVQLHLGGLPLSIAGKVVDGEGRPRGGAQVWVIDPTPFGAVDGECIHVESFLRGGASFWSVNADAEGRFRIGGLLDREYRLAALDPDSLLLGTAGPASAGRLDVVIALPKDGLYERLAGRVVSREGTGVAGVQVEAERDLFRVAGPGSTEERFQGVTHSASRGGTRTDEEGRFELQGVPREGVHLRLAGDAILPKEHRVSKEDRLEEIRIVVALRCHLRIELADPSEAVDRVAVLDEKGANLVIDIMLGNGRITGETTPIEEGRTGVLAVSDAARTLVLYRGEEEARRVPLRLVPGELNVVRP